MEIDFDEGKGVFVFKTYSATVLVGASDGELEITERAAMALVKCVGWPLAQHVELYEGRLVAEIQGDWPQKGPRLDIVGDLLEGIETSERELREPYVRAMSEAAKEVAEKFEEVFGAKLTP